MSTAESKKGALVRIVDGLATTASLKVNPA
jgi:hypothetical protein